MGQGIRNVPHTSVRIAVAVVYGLDAASGRGVVFGGGNLQMSSVRQRPDGLHKSLSEGTLAHDGRPVHILKRSCHNLRSRGAARIHEHHQRQLEVERVLVGLVGHHVLGVAPACGHHHRTPWNKERYNGDGFLKQPASVAAKVENELFHTLPLELEYL